MITILPLCEVVEIVPGLWAFVDTGKTLAEFVREQAKAHYGEIATLSLDSVEVDGDEVRVRATVRMKADAQFVNVTVSSVVAD